MKYTKKQLKESIAYWKKILESRESDKKEACMFLDNYAEERGYKFYGMTAEPRDSVEEAIEDLYSDFAKKLKSEIIDYINDDPERHGIEYHDDSDYDREYGYGQYGEYDQAQIADLAREMTEDELAGAEEDMVKMFQAWKKSGKNEDYMLWLSNGDPEDDVCIGWNDDYDFGITMSKE